MRWISSFSKFCLRKIDRNICQWNVTCAREVEHILFYHWLKYLSELDDLRLLPLLSSPGNSKRVRFMYRGGFLIHCTRRNERDISGRSLRHLSTPNLPWNIMKHLIVSCVPATATRSVKIAQRRAVAFEVHRRHPRCFDDLQGRCITTRVAWKRVRASFFFSCN